MSPPTIKFDRIATHNVHKPMLFIDASGISIWVAAQFLMPSYGLERHTEFDRTIEKLVNIVLTNPFQNPPPYERLISIGTLEIL